MNGRVRYLSSGAGIALRIIVIAAVAVGAGWIGQALWGVSVWVLIWQNRYFWYSVLLGALTGAAEVIARYRDEPFAATFSLPGVSYLIMNGAISGTAYGLLSRYADKIFPAISDELIRSIVAGFGAMVVMRSKLFNFKTESGEDYAVGPDAVLSTFLAAVDRKIDRYRSLRRQQLAFEKTSSIADPVAAPAFLRTSLASYQNRADAEKRDLDEAIKEIVADTNLDPRLKLMAISFGLLNVCGERNFANVMDLLRDYQLPRPDGRPSDASETKPPSPA